VTIHTIQKLGKPYMLGSFMLSETLSRKAEGGNDEEMVVS
jgi:hypothetical protein